MLGGSIDTDCGPDALRETTVWADRGIDRHNSNGPRIVVDNGFIIYN